MICKEEFTTNQHEPTRTKEELKKKLTQRRKDAKGRKEEEFNHGILGELLHGMR
ncbi:hypothetical protein R84B8_02956 [Treponema sp. R8-4-B8]